MQGSAECEVCTLGGDEVYRSCAAPELDPDFCLVYGDDEGECLDCFNGGELIMHACHSNNEQQNCSTYDTIDGQTCTVCTTAAGVVISSTCAPESSPAFYCEELLFSEQTCTACLDENGGLDVIQCARNNCEDPGVNCPPPAPCSNYFDANNRLCRECALEQDPRILETRCMGERPGGVSCATQTQQIEGNNNIVGEEDCLVCDYNGDDFYEICESEGELTPPYCESFGECVDCFAPDSGALVLSTCGGVYCGNEVDADGQLCERCYDSGTDALVSETCDQCLRLDGQQPLTQEGDVLLLPADASLSCLACDEEADLPLVACVVDVDCDGVPLPDPFQGESCFDERAFARPVTYCDEPWGQFGPGIERTLAAAGWLSQNEIGYRVVVFQDDPNTDETCQSCGCESGETLIVSTRVQSNEEATLAELGFYEIN